MPECPSCGADEPTGTGYCSYCGRKLPRPVPEPSQVSPEGDPYRQQSRAPAYPPGQPPIKNWLIESVLVTILCCMPLGIGGIINASSVDRLASYGDFEGARRAASRARSFVLAAVVTGVLSTLVYVVMQFIVSIGER